MPTAKEIMARDQWKLLLQWHDQHAGCGAHTGGHDHHQKGDRKNNPSVMQPARGWPDLQ
jgi:hypothetical protein